MCVGQVGVFVCVCMCMCVYAHMHACACMHVSVFMSVYHRMDILFNC